MVDKVKATGLREKGLTYKQISSELNCSVEWCKQNLKGVTKGVVINNQVQSILSDSTAEDLGRLDYNKVEWGDYFYLDEDSPTGLRWLQQERPYRHKGDAAGYPQRTSKGNRWVVSVANHIWVVSRIIHVMLNGNFDSLLVVDHLDGDPSNNSFNNLEIKTSRGNAQNTVWCDKGLPRGISYKEGNNASCFEVNWREVSGKKRSKTFSCKKLGEETALSSAIAFRKFCLESLNKEGMQYTTRHS